MTNTIDSVITVAVGFVLALGGLAERPESNVPLMVVGAFIIALGMSCEIKARKEP